MSGCGGKMMSKGGKVAPVKIKKMSTGGSSNPCPKGYHVNEAGGCSENMFHTLGSKIGLGIPLTGAAAIATDAIVKGIKKFNEKRKTKKAAKVASKTTTTTEEKRRGGAMYKSGGIAKQTIVAFPGYNARTDTMKKGGSTKKFAALAPPYDKATYADKIVGAKKKAKFGASVPVQHSPAPGRVRSSSGMGTVPVGTRKQKGGSIKRK